MTPGDYTNFSGTFHRIFSHKIRVEYCLVFFKFYLDQKVLEQSIYGTV